MSRAFHCPATDIECIADTLAEEAEARLGSRDSEVDDLVPHIPDDEA